MLVHFVNLLQGRADMLKKMYDTACKDIEGRNFDRLFSNMSAYDEELKEFLKLIEDSRDFVEDHPNGK